MNYLAFDIETIPNQLLPDECKPQFDPESVKYGNTKDPVKRQAKEDESRKTFDASITKTMSLDPAFCSICTFAAKKVYNDEVERFSWQLIGDDGHDDLDVIEAAVKIITQAYNQRIPLVSFNGLSFDLPVILFRAIAQDIPINVGMWQKIVRRYTNQHHYDLMQILSGWDRQKWHKQDFYVSLLGVYGTNFMDGSMVFDCYQAKEYKKIEEYCINDVEGLSCLFERVYPWVAVELKIEEEDSGVAVDEELSKSFEEAQAS